MHCFPLFVYTGMTAAAFTIFWMQIKLEWHSIVFCSFGAMFGMILGLEVLDDLLDPPTKKLGFVCVWFSFAFALYLLNRYLEIFQKLFVLFELVLSKFFMIQFFTWLVTWTIPNLMRCSTVGYFALIWLIFRQLLLNFWTFLRPFLPSI